MIYKAIDNAEQKIYPTWNNGEIVSISIGDQSS